MGTFARNVYERSAGSAAQDVALAALLGGNLFGRLAMNPALGSVGDPAERGKVLNRAWRRYGTVNSLALATLLATWLPARLREREQRRPPGGPLARLRDVAGPRLRVGRRAEPEITPRERTLTHAKDIAMAAVFLSGIASAIGGVWFARQAPEGAVPMQSGRDASPETPPRAAFLKRLVNGVGALNLTSELALAVINASLQR
jgi:hypothetical protein